MSSAVNRHSLPEVLDTPREPVLHTQGSTTYKSPSPFPILEEEEAGTQCGSGGGAGKLKWVAPQHSTSASHFSFFPQTASD